jgi:prevent-host-death family protein
MTMVKLNVVLRVADMRTMAAGEFKAKCLAVMDEVRETGQIVCITKRGIPIAKLGPVADVPSEKKSMFGRLKHMGAITGDIVSSEFSDNEWDRMFDERWARFEQGSED